jgi:hypothetical protein
MGLQIHPKPERRTYKDGSSTTTHTTHKRDIDEKRNNSYNIRMTTPTTRLTVTTPKTTETTRTTPRKEVTRTSTIPTATTSKRLIYERTGPASIHKLNPEDTSTATTRQSRWGPRRTTITGQANSTPDVWEPLQQLRTRINSVNLPELPDIPDYASRRNKRNVQEADTQFVEHDLNERMKHLAKLTCSMINDHADEIEDLMTTSPTLAMRRLLHRNNLIAKSLSQEIIEIEFCYELKSDEYTILPNEHGCTIPFQLKSSTNQTWHINRATHQLHRDPSKTEEDECDKTTFITLEGSLWNYNYATGLLTLTHETLNSNRSTKENWNFLNRETIFNEIAIRDVQNVGYEDEILDEIEKVQEGFAQIVKEDQTEIKSSTSDLGDDIIGAILDRYFLKIWRIWISIICAFQSYAIFDAIKQRLRGNTPQFIQGSTNMMPTRITNTQPSGDNQQVYAQHLRTSRTRKRYWFSKNRSPITLREERIPLQEISSQRTRVQQPEPERPQQGEQLAYYEVNAKNTRKQRRSSSMINLLLREN